MTGSSSDPGARDFVGREQEMRVLRAALGDARQGRGRLVLLVGEPGIGKTRTAMEFAAEARKAGACVLWGACYDGEWAPPFGPFAEAIAAYARQCAPDTLRADLGFGAAPIARVIPAVRERLPEVPEPEALQPDEERFRLLDAVSQFLVAVGQRMPVVLVLDDLHWADKDTITMLRHVARCAPQHRLLLLGTYRDVELDAQHPLADALGALYRETTCERILLRGLDAVEVAQLVADGGVPADRRDKVAAAINAVTSGNPFFVREVLQHLAELAREPTDGNCTTVDRIDVPDSVRQVLNRRVRRLGAEAGHLLSVAAGFGGAFHLAVAARVAGLDEAVALNAIDAALRAQLVRPAEPAERYDFTHALVRETLYSELSPSRQARLHRQIAKAMEHVYGDRVAEHAAEVAQQYYRSRDVPGAEPGVAYAATAADRAQEMYAHEEVVRLLHIAVDLTPPTAPRPARLLSRLALALTWVLNFDEAVQAAHEAGELIAGTEGPAAAADYLGEATVNLIEAGSMQSAWKVARQGMAHVGARRDLTWLRLANCDVMRREQEDAEFPGIPLDCPERREMSVVVRSLLPDELTGIPLFIPLASREEVRCRWPQVGFNWTGDFRGSLPALEEGAARYEREGRINSAAQSFVGVARCRLALGEIAAADEAYRHGILFRNRLPITARVRLSFAGYRTERCMVVNEGWDEVVPLTGNLAEQAGAENRYALAPIRVARAVILARLGRTESACQMLATIHPAIDRAPAWAPNYTMMACNAALTLWWVQRLDHAECIERNLRDKVIASDFRFPMIDGRLALAQVCALQRRYDDAAEWFARARAVLEEQGARPLRAIVDYDEALMYVRRGEPGDAKRAAPLLEAALAQFRDIGMPGWTRCAEHLLREGREWKPSAAQPEQQPDRQGLHPWLPGGAPAGLPGQNPTDDESATEPRQGRHSRARGEAPGESTAADDVCVFRQEGEYWTLAYHGQTARLRDTKGLFYIARLLAQPGRDLHVRDLATMSQRSDPGNGSEPVRVEGDLGTILDARATAQYKERLAEARQELDEATAAGDLGQAERLQHEIESLTEQLTAAYGLGGRPRTAGDPAERVRKAVTNQIRRALDRIGTAHPELGRHLTNALRTGFVCTYHPEHPVAWRL